MAIIGFMALVVLGLYLFVAGVGGLVGIMGFSGKFSWAALMVAAVGVAILVAAWRNAPFTVTFAGIG